MDCDFSVVGMVVGVHLARVFFGDWLIIYMIFLKTCIENFMCGSLSLLFCIQYVLFIKILLHTEIWLFLKVLDCMTRVSQFYEGEQNYRKLREQFYTQSVRPNGQGNKKSICFGLHRTYTFHSVFILAFVYCCSLIIKMFTCL